MAQVIITFKITPSNPDADMDELSKFSFKIIEKHDGFPGKSEIKPLAFGLKELHIIFTRNEDLGSTDDMEEEIAKLDDVTSVNVIDIRRAIG